MFQVSRVTRVHKSTLSIINRSFVKVGDKVPVNYLKDEKPPTVLDDKDYPTWVFDIGKKGLTKQELVDKFNQVGVENMTTIELRRMKRLMGLDAIKATNASKVVDKD